MATIKAKGFYDVADPDVDPDDGDQYDKQLFIEKQSFVSSVLVTSLQTDKEEKWSRSLNEMQGPSFPSSTITILSQMLHITSLCLTDSWKGTTCKFLSHFKEKLHLLDSLVPDTDKIPETVQITFLQRAVQKNHDLRQILVLDSVWRSKTGSTGNFIFEVYYDLLWNAAYQHDLNNLARLKKRQVFISQQVDSFII